MGLNMPKWNVRSVRTVRNCTISQKISFFFVRTNGNRTISQKIAFLFSVRANDVVRYRKKSQKIAVRFFAIFSDFFSDFLAIFCDIFRYRSCEREKNAIFCDFLRYRTTSQKIVSTNVPFGGHMDNSAGGQKWSKGLKLGQKGCRMGKVG